TMTNQEKWLELKELLKEIEIYGRCEGRAYFDMECIAPEEGIEKAGEDVALLSLQIFRLTHADRYIELLSELAADNEGLTKLQKRTVELLYDQYSKTKNIPEDFAHKMDLDGNKAYADWLSAKKAKDFSKFRDSFANVIENNRKAVQLRDEQKETVYDTLLDDYEKGGSIAQLDEFFGKLKARILPLLHRILTDGKPIRDDFLTRPVSIPQQEAFSRYLMETEGLRKTATVLATTEHPFTTHFGPTDVRVTTHYYENNFISNIFSTMHEGGHALFMQNEPQENYDEFTADGMTSAMHECISRFYENIVGRSEAFIHYIYPKLSEFAGHTFDDVSERELYEAVNIAQPGFIRCDADELTYCLHILIRYELEKAFVNGEIGVDEVPALWNAKYKEYLGLDVPDDALGCLQDVHWTGSYGYFPSYALGSAYGAQILRTMEKDFDFYGAIREGNFGKILDWLKERVFPIASLMTPDEWIRAITGESLNVDYFLDYLEEKFTALYGL
ncbi:MAG: carboxypeptidase M32, partial [Lachnospiraceae bacterium]|nr:carboxypeptidase M32 [Lachnospiraceae bacterium]